MKVYQRPEDFEKLPYAIVTSGTFDGVHKGHQKIFERLSELKRQTGGESIIITFWPHPRKIVDPQSEALKILSTLDEKIELLSKQDIDHLIIIPFTKEFSELTSEQFIQKILVETISTKILVMGYDHRFGKNREGGFEFLKENSKLLGFEVEEISRQDIDEIAISSSNIRKALRQGNLFLANELLGRPYSIQGTVEEGLKLGRQLGYPTANIKVKEPDKLIPKDGVYAVMVRVKDREFGGMLNIGYNPTIEGKGRSIEVNIFDFNESIYNEKLEIAFIQYMRDELKFSGLDELKSQLATDELTARSIIESEKSKV